MLVGMAPTELVGHRVAIPRDAECFLWRNGISQPFRTKRASTVVVTEVDGHNAIYWERQSWKVSTEDWLAIPEPGYRRCSACLTIKPDSEFSEREPRCRPCLALRARSYAAANRERRAATYKRWKAANPEYSRNYMRMWYHGLTPERFDELLATQLGRCAICRRELDRYAKTTHIDHDRGCCPTSRSCGKCVRGLLCHWCNTAIGLMPDPASLRAAATYLS